MSSWPQIEHAISSALISMSAVGNCSANNHSHHKAASPRGVAVFCRGQHQPIFFTFSYRFSEKNDLFFRGIFSSEGYFFPFFFSKQALSPPRFFLVSTNFPP